MPINEQINKYSKLIWDSQLTKQDEELLQCIVNDSIYIVKDIKSDLNIDSDYYLYLAYNASRHGYKYYDDKNISILKNILTTYKLQKMSKIQSISKVLKCLNDNGIKPLLIKGLALISYYSIDIPRMMNDIDIYINPSQYDKAVSLILNLGFDFISDTGYHIGTTSKNLDIDIHRSIYKNHGDKNSQIFERLIPIKFLGSDAYVLSREDMFLHQIINRGKDISTHNHLDRHLKWIIDCYYIAGNKTLNFKNLLNEAKKLNNLYYAQLTLSKYSDLFPDLFNDKYTYFNDKHYAMWLKFISKSLQNMRFNIKDKGLKRFLYSLEYHYNAAMDLKYVENLKLPIILLILKISNINTIKEFINRFKKLISNCKFF